MARSELREIRGALGSVLKLAAGGGGGEVLAPVWEEAVGAQLAQHSKVRRLEAAGVLVVEVEACFIDELRGVREVLRERLNARLGRASVSRIDLVAR